MKLTLNLVKTTKKYWGYLLIALIAIGGMTASQLYAPLVIRRLTNMIIANDPALETGAVTMAITLAIVYFVQCICTYIRSYYTHYAAWRFVADLRADMYTKLQSLSLKYFHDKQTGQLMARLVSDTDKIEVLIAHAVPDILVNVVLLVGVAIILFIINPILAAVSLISIPLLFVASVWFAKKVLPMFRDAQQSLGVLNANLQDNISGMREIHVFNQHTREKERITQDANNYSNIIIKSLRLSALYVSSTQYVSNLGVVAVIALGGYWAWLGLIPFGDVIAFAMYIGIFYAPIATLVRVNEDLQNSIASAERVFDILHAQTDLKEIEDPHNLTNVLGNIKFSNVNFYYTDGNPVLKNINIDIKQGEMVALVGPTGVGKTTIINLLNRFYDPIDGDVFVDNYNLKEVSLKSLRDNISSVNQDVFLFNSTIEENIRYGAPKATKSQIIEAAKKAKAHDFIEEFKDGYNTIVGERGVRLSGGQKQRVSIARAILRNSPILILDEATASVDVKTEKEIQEAMDDVAKGRTTIVIAHRLSTIKKADKIIVLKDGAIEEIGTHIELTNKGGLYSTLNNINDV